LPRAGSDPQRPCAAEDANIAVEHGIHCVYVSNHGGWQLDQGVVRSTCCRRSSTQLGEGADPLGADAVACGRLYVYGLAAGVAGMVRLFETLEDEIRICLSLLGVTGYHELDKSYVRPARQVVPPHVHSAFPHLNLAHETY
jgi:glycolate oxidase